MTAKTFNTNDVDRIFRWIVVTILTFGAGILVLGVGTFADVSFMRIAGYFLIVAAFMILGFVSWPALKR